MKNFQKKLLEHLDKKRHVIPPMQRRRKLSDGIDWAKIMERKRKELEEQRRKQTNPTRR